MGRRSMLLFMLIPITVVLKGALPTHESSMDPGVGSQEISDVASGDVMQGRSLARQCLGCHSIDGSTEFGPTWKGLYGAEVRLQDGRVVVADEAYLIESIRDPAAKIREGYPPVMPTYPSLSDQDIADINAYIKTHESSPSPVASTPDLRQALATPSDAVRFGDT